jgi:hypothetical protein
MADESLDSFLDGLQGNLLTTAVQARHSNTPKVDEGFIHATTRTPNAVEWGTGAKWLGVDSLFHHVRQYQILRDFFQLRCPLPSCNDQSEAAADCWGKGREYLQSENLLVFNTSANEDVCPSCKTTRSEFNQDKLFTLYNQMHLVCGMRSGKTSVAAVMGTYIEHCIIALGHKHGLDKYFKQLPGQKLDITFIASTDVQSKDTIWAKYTELRRHSDWYQNYVRWTKKLEVEQKTPNGMKPLSYEELEKEIRNDFLGLNVKSMNSNSGGMAGRTRIAAFVDELARFEVSDTARGADEVYRVLENSLRTIRSISVKNPEIPWLGTMVSVSSPISIEDKSMRLLKQAPQIKGMYAKHYATWDFNPEQPRDMFDDDFSKDPIGAMRDFGAMPPSAASPLISDPDMFRRMAIQPDLKPTTQFRQVVHTDRAGREYISAQLTNSRLSSDGERFICFDASSSFDQFAGACAHGEWVETPEGRQLITVYDWVFRLLPEGKPRRDVWFDFVVQVIEQMAKSYVIGRVEFDRWQSTYLIQQIRDRGISTEMRGTKTDDFLKFVADVNFSRVRMLPPNPDDAQLEPPFMSAQGLAFYELERLERDTDLGKVYNPRKGQRRGYNSDDVATVVVHVNDMVQSTVVDLSTSNTRQVRLHREQMGGSNWSGRGALFRPVNKVNGRGW